MVHPTTAEWTEMRSIITQSLLDLADVVVNITDVMSTDVNYINDINATVAMNPNNTSEEVHYEGYQYRPETYIVPIIFGIIFLAGLMGNGMLIAVFVKHRTMRNVPNT